MTQLKWTAHCFETNPSIFWYLSTPWCLGIYRYCYMCVCFGKFSLAKPLFLVGRFSATGNPDWSR